MPLPHPRSTKLWSFFIERVRANLHIVLCFSPVGPKFATRARMFPGLINGCLVDWYLPWPDAALVEVAMGYLVDFKPEGGDDVKRGLIEHVAYVHAAVSQGTTQYFEQYRRAVYVTPRTYLAFLTAYSGTYLNKKEGIALLADNINTGLDKLVQAIARV